MTLRLVFHPAARAELLDAQQWYEARAAGLGLEFARAVEAAVMAIRRNPSAFPVVYEGIRQAVLRRFPYSVLFAVEAEAVVVLACFHHRRDPRIWRERASGP